MAEPGAGGSTRRQARERALELLYECEAKGVPVADVLAELPLDPDPYARDLVVGVAERQAQVDELIRRFSRGWSLERMPAVDRALLRMAIYELLARPDVPLPVVISEAVDLARQYSTEDSGKFVNGMLAHIAAEVRPDPS